MQCVNVARRFCTKPEINTSKQLYKYLLKACKNLPDGPKQHYIFSIKQVIITIRLRIILWFYFLQSFKQHINETDETRIQQMISKSLNDAKWLLDKVNRTANIFKTNLKYFFCSITSKMFRVPLITSSNALNVEQFWTAVFLYHNSPHLVNRRLLGIKQLFLLRIKFNNKNYKLKDVFNYSELELHFRRQTPFSFDNITKDIIINVLELNTNNFTCEEVQLEDVENDDSGTFISVRVLLPRLVKAKKCVEIAIIGIFFTNAVIF